MLPNTDRDSPTGVVAPCPITFNFSRGGIMPFGTLKPCDMNQQRICIYPSDIAVLTGKGVRYARETYQELFKSLKKEKHQVIAYYELAEFLGMSDAVVLKIINNKPILKEEE